MSKNSTATKEDLKRLEKNLGERILNSEVKILGELKDMREEHSVHQSSHRRINDEIQDHEKGIKNLESASI
jgi:hypothetical protein